MEKEKLQELCNQKNYPTYFTEDLIKLYPIMVNHFGIERTDEFLKNWKYVFINTIANSGGTWRKKKEISVNEYNRNLLWGYRIITALFHEPGHAMGTLNIDTEDFLSDGDIHENFFEKMEEAVVSDYQDDLLNGELQYDYASTYNVKCRGDVLHAENYLFEKLYYNVFKIILGSERKLVPQMMYEKDKEKKKSIFNKIKNLLEEKLDVKEYKTLIDSCAILIINHGYSPLAREYKFMENRKYIYQQIYKWNYNQVAKGEVSKEEYDKEVQEWVVENFDKKYIRVLNYTAKNEIFNNSIQEQTDHLCEMTLDYLTKRLESMEEYDFELIKSTCEYFSKINNKAPELRQKTENLRNLLSPYISTLEESIAPEIKELYSKKEQESIMLKFLSLQCVNNNSINNFKICKMENDTQDERNSFIYITDGTNIIKIGRYSDLVKDDMKNMHDSSMNGIYVDTVISPIELSFSHQLGDNNVRNIKQTDKSFCQVDWNKEWKSGNKLQ